MTAVLRMLRQLCERAGIEPQSDAQRRVDALMEETNVHDVMQQIDRGLAKE